MLPALHLKSHVLLAVLLLSFPAISQDKPKLAELDLADDVLTVDGFWEPDNPTTHNELIPTAIHIQCFRHGGKASNLTKTEAFCIVATASAASGILVADSSLEEANWSEDEVVISDESPICIVSKTFFDLKRRTVTGLDIRKPEAKGFNDSCKIFARPSVLLPKRQG